MSKADRQTMKAYADRIDDYLSCAADDEAAKDARSFAQLVHKGGRVLDLGCGPGHCAAEMMAAGLKVDATDASPDMVKSAQAKFGVNAQLKTFDQLDAVGLYDGVFANFSLLHAPKSSFDRHLVQIRTTMKPGGILHLGMKTGKGEKRDRLGRFYAYYSEDDLKDHLGKAGFFKVTVLRTGSGPGLAGGIDPYIIMRAHA